MALAIIQDYKHPFVTQITITQISQELQAFRSRMMAIKDAEKVIAAHVISSEHVTRFLGTSIRGRQTTNLFYGVHSTPGFGRIPIEPNSSMQITRHRPASTCR